MLIRFFTLFLVVFGTACNKDNDDDSTETGETAAPEPECTSEDTSACLTYEICGEGECIVGDENNDVTEAEALLLHANDVVCYEEEEDGEASAGLIIVDAIHADQRAVSGRALRAVGQGPWKDRTWQIDVTAYQAHRAQVGFGRLLCRVELENAKLSGGSVESMRKSGVVL